MLAGFGVLPSVSRVTAGAALETAGIAPAPGWQQALTAPSQVHCARGFILAECLYCTLLGGWKILATCKCSDDAIVQLSAEVLAPVQTEQPFLLDIQLALTGPQLLPVNQAELQTIATTVQAVLNPIGEQQAFWLLCRSLVQGSITA